jgi:hypothetical protein
MVLEPLNAEDGQEDGQRNPLITGEEGEDYHHRALYYARESVGNLLGTIAKQTGLRARAHVWVLQMSQEIEPKPKPPRREPDKPPRPERDREQWVHDVTRAEAAAARRKGRKRVNR